MSRVLDLHRYLAAQHGRAFEPGTFDGALFAAGWIEVLTGENPAAAFAGRYRSVQAGLRLIRRETGLDLPGLVARHTAPVGGWMRAEPGDLAVIGLGSSICVGIVGGAHLHVVSPRGGLDVLPIGPAMREVLRP